MYHNPPPISLRAADSMEGSTRDHSFPWAYVNKEKMLAAVKKYGFSVDFSQITKEIEKFPGTECLFIRDHKRLYECTYYFWMNSCSQPPFSSSSKRDFLTRSQTRETAVQRSSVEDKIPK